MTNKKKKTRSMEDKPLNPKIIINEAPKVKNDCIFAKLYRIITSITVEPILSGLVIPSTLSSLAIQNLNLDKTCRIKLDYGDEICNALIERKGNLSSYEAEVQKIISNIEAWKSVIQTAIPTVLVIFMGAWSDRTGNRKVCILLPLFGELMVCLSNLLSTYFFNQISVEVTMFLEGIFPAITGGYVMVFMGVFSYISDITDERSRTFRIGLVNLFLTVGIPIGMALSGIMLKLFGYYGVFSIAATIYVITICYGFFCLESNTKANRTSRDEVKSVTCSDMVTLVKETGEVAVKKRESNYRKKIILTLLVVAIVYGPDHGERIITYMYVRYKLKWDALKYSLYSTYSIITHSIGALFSISVFSKRWGFHDSALCLISIVSKLAGSILIAFVTTDLQMFMVPIVEILNATTFTSLRSMASKLVPSEEMGKMNSLFSLVETLAALVFDPTYSSMYSHTITRFSGTVYIFSACMTLPPISLLVWFFVQNRKEQKEKKRQEAQDLHTLEEVPEKS
ncbi:lysosomal proton-coupled steroid conjugate and bile acid symporter SLC46A3-like isoform X1 [Anticarsia gemmatalis]|uniref:lysosomal proton-coupled steroid conjugate and bile acid symporter SLC46A3-like isoform X1 n=1 Tax=Anticarsia gemmatalis TaxID=129554 RepID=UPI003F7673E6